jgi:hypothetical protein
MTDILARRRAATAIPRRRQFKIAGRTSLDFQARQGQLKLADAGIGYEARPSAINASLRQMDRENQRKWKTVWLNADERR